MASVKGKTPDAMILVTYVHNYGNRKMNEVFWYGWWGIDNEKGTNEL